MEANNVEKRFNDWFTVSYDRLRNLVGRYGALDEDNFHDTYLFVRKQVLNPEREITDYEAYFIGCYRKAFMAKFRLESKYAHPDEYFFLRCGEDADFLSPDDLNSCEKLVKDILNFIRRKFSYQEYRMFTLRFYESDFSFKALGEMYGYIGKCHFRKSKHDHGYSTVKPGILMEKPDAGSRRIHILIR